MKTHRNAGFTILELVFVIIVVVILLGLLIPALYRERPAKRIRCTSHLKQIAMALRMWSNEHAEHFPMELTTAEGGTRESILQGLPLTSFRILSNELNNPRPLTCPADEARKQVKDFAQLTPKNLSYFLAVDASERNPQLILSGDRNLCINGQPTNGFVQITNWSTVTWGQDIHQHQANIGLADGSAHQVTDLLFQKQLGTTGLTTNRFAIP